MTRSFLMSLALAAACSPALAHEPSHHAVDAPRETATDPALAAAYAVVDRFGAALSAGDFDTVRSLLADDVLILEMGGAERSREEYMAEHAIGDAAFLGGSAVTRTHRTGGVDGRTAWVATESGIAPVAGSDAKPMLSTETMLLRKDGATWRIAHIHWSSRPQKVTP